MPERNEQAGDVKKGRIHFDFVFIANHQAAVISQPRKRALDLPTFAIAAQGAAVLERGPTPVLAMRTDQLGAPPLQFPAGWVAVVGLVGNDPA